MNAARPNDQQYDVAIIGGSLSGAATAILLLRELPQLRVLVVEKAPQFTRKVGEATVEVSAFFLGRVLDLTQHLNESHLVKQGMRFWFSNQDAHSLADCSEIGPRYQVRLPAYQVDRSVLDEEVLRRARELGVTLMRPAKVTRVQLSEGGEQSVTVQQGEDTQRITARWVVDASGFAAQLARQEGWHRPNEAHPTCAIWSRWRGVKDWDSRELATKFPAWSMAAYGLRSTATNHLTGDGWWAWWIPLKGGDVSIGVVYDQRRVEWPKGGSQGQKLKDFLSLHPAGKELLEKATWVDGDVHVRRQLPYSTTTFAGDGFALVGDAAAFLDPLYSPGMDWITYTVCRSVDLIVAQQRGDAVAPLAAKHNRDFRRSYDRWFAAVYQDKYEYLGEFDLMRLAFTMDLGFFYLGIVSQPFKRGEVALREPVFMTPPSTPFFYFMRAYNRRFARIASARRERRVLGQHNTGQRFLFPGFSLEPASGKLLVKAVCGWAWLELAEGWRTWFRGRVEDPASSHVSAPTPAELT